jgi:hypothetical protein
MWLKSQIYGLRNRYVALAAGTDMWLESKVNGLRNRYVAGESDIGPQKQICGWRVIYMASETDMWLKS